jgi:hypothetical protein
MEMVKLEAPPPW